jgi:hypothetical protein
MSNLLVSAIESLERAFYRRKLKKFRDSLASIQGVAIGLIDDFLNNSNELSFGHPNIEVDVIECKINEFEQQEYAEIGIASPEWTRETYIWSRRNNEWVILFSSSTASVIEFLNFILTEWPILFPSHSFNPNNKELTRLSANERLLSVQLPYYNNSVYVVFFKLIQTEHNILSLKLNKCVAVTC